MSEVKQSEKEESGKIGEYLANLRRERGYSLRGVEKATDHKVSNAYLSQLEHGKIKRPSPNILYCLSDVYDAKYEDLMRLAGYASGESDNTPSLEKQLPNQLSIDNLTTDEHSQLVEYLEFYRSRKHAKE